MPGRRRLDLVPRASSGGPAPACGHGSHPVLHPAVVRAIRLALNVPLSTKQRRARQSDDRDLASTPAGAGDHPHRHREDGRAGGHHVGSVTAVNRYDRVRARNRGGIDDRAGLTSRTRVTVVTREAVGFVHVRALTGHGIADPGEVALVQGRADDRRPDAGPALTAIAGRTGEAIVTTGPVRLGRIGADSGGGIAGPRGVALIRRRAEDGVGPGAGAAVAGLRPVTGVAVRARSAVGDAGVRALEVCRLVAFIVGAGVAVVAPRRWARLDNLVGRHRHVLRSGVPYVASRFIESAVLGRTVAVRCLL